MKIKFQLLFFLLLLLVNQTDALTHSFSSIRDENRYVALTNEIRCLVCQNQSIADSQSPLAKDLSEKIYQMITEQKSDQEIKNYLVKRYGEFILLKPRWNKLTFFLWMLPFLGLGSVLLFQYCFFRQQKRSSFQKQ